MKSHFILILGFLALIGVQPLAAQSDEEHYETPNCSCNYVANTIGRVYETNGYDYIISYHQHNTHNEFLISDYANPNPNNVIRMELEEGLFVNDFEILDHEVYFCGELNNVGVIGFFDINDFLSQTAVPQYAKIYQSDMLEKMEVYVDPITTNIVIAAVGITTALYQQAPTTSTLYAIEIDPSGAINYNYFSQTNSSSIDYHYWFQDVTITKNYIVTSGVKDVAYDHFIISKIDKSDLSHIHYYIYQETSGQLSDKYEIETLFKDEVALATLNSFNTRIHTYDAISDQFLHSQDIPLEAKNPVIDLQFMDFDSSLIVLHRDEYPNPHTTNIVMKYADPYPSAIYSVDFIYDTKAKYASLDRFPGTTFFLASGELNENNHAFLKLNKAFSGVPLCLDENNIEAAIISFPTLFTYVYWDLLSDTSSFEPVYVIYTDDNFVLQCHN